MQIQVIIDIIGANDFSPMFDLPRYTVALQEYNSFTRTSLITPGDTIATVHATDRDGPATAAGTLEYRIANGATLLGVEMFSIPNPSVSRCLANISSCQTLTMTVGRRGDNITTRFAGL